MSGWTRFERIDGATERRCEAWRGYDWVDEGCIWGGFMCSFTISTPRKSHSDRWTWPGIFTLQRVHPFPLRLAQVFVYSASDLSDSRECSLTIGVYASATGSEFTRLATGNDLAAVKALSQGSIATKPLLGCRSE